MKRYIRIVKSTIIVIICLCVMGYMILHYDGKEYGIEQVNGYINRMCEIANVPGMSIAVLNDEQEYYINTGYANKKTKEKSTSDTRIERKQKQFLHWQIFLVRQLP